MTWVFLTDTERNKISHEAGAYIVDSYEPHEAAVRQRNPKENWVGLTDEERDAIRATFVTGKIFYVKDMLAAFEAKLKEKNGHKEKP